jgi:hypothetical protein
MSVFKPRATPIGSAADDDLIFIDRQGVPFVRNTVSSGRDTGRHRERAGFVPGYQLGPDGRFIRVRAASHRPDGQSNASCDLQAESLDDRRKVCIDAINRRACPESELALVLVDPNWGGYDWVSGRVHDVFTELSPP